MTTPPPQSVVVPMRGPGHCDDDAAWAEFVRQYDGQPRSRPDMTDFALANRVFMADRNDLDLIVWQTAAKERIRWLSIELAKAQAAPAPSFQDRCGTWLDVCFGPESRADIAHRNARFLEEAVELVQAAGMGESAAVDVVRYVFTRPQGDINQEVGGVMMTLAAHCLATGVDMGTAAEAELARVWTKVDAIRKKEAAKPTFAALTPRHGAPASHAFEASHSVHREGGCKFCGHDEASHEAPADPIPAEWTGQGTDDDFFKPAKAAFSEGVTAAEISATRHAKRLLNEAPAEGAGERDRLREIDTLTRQVTPDIATAQWLLASIQEITEPALRARSSAPEAREGEPVYDQNCRGFDRIIGYRTAAPSADKLRTAVEALEPFARAAEKLDGLWSEDDWRWNDSVRSGVTVRDIRCARQALAALKAEDA